ncbi:hypothetical protein L226DRAFT_371799 [Lentinus tigrinus ALCF2SS1-7]|uniref:Uncharacterized protein n=1 Tax=Lentinus tigrinus ALCF2SS1-6 TaxID=1328759 RepID=A0A5C2SKB6_9APHY|nr:hypothetical protein L227DRAFT_316958 [Lentinus tigrinus ALCF2SS1-6]RPD76272.1 hypothetical protein L226DRAFT_371799 [Lentinus tigrinus ALCF2SS1-7]
MITSHLCIDRLFSNPSLRTSTLPVYHEVGISREEYHQTSVCAHNPWWSVLRGPHSQLARLWFMDVFTWTIFLVWMALNHLRHVSLVMDYPVFALMYQLCWFIPFCFGHGVTH